MSNLVDITLLDNSLNFKTTSDFKWCMNYGGEIEFLWNEKIYCAFGKLKNPKTGKIQICICEADQSGTDQWYDTSDESLEYLLAGKKRLRDVITQIKVIDRTIS